MFIIYFVHSYIHTEPHDIGMCLHDCYSLRLGVRLEAQLSVSVVTKIFYAEKYWSAKWPMLADGRQLQ